VLLLVPGKKFILATHFLLLRASCAGANSATLSTSRRPGLSRNWAQALSYVYYEDEPGRRSAAKLLSKDEARRIAVNSPNCPSY
jgi:hypothetical protein